MLQEMTEEWEQCERKLRECREWSDRSRGALGLPPSGSSSASSSSSLRSSSARARPLRDQVSHGERVAAEVAVQRQKAIMAVEKLQVRKRELDGMLRHLFITS